MNPENAKINSIPPCIALDVGNCCIKVSDKECLKKLGITKIEDVPQNFLKACELLECGKISEQNWLCEFRKATKNRFSDPELINAWNSIICDEIEGMDKVLEEITSLGVRVIFLSDTSNLHIKYAIRKMKLSIYVSGGIYSYKVGCRKPDPNIYQAFENSYGKPIIYTDDKPENIEAARKLGWNAHLYNSPEKFLTEFYCAYEKIKNI